MSATNRNAAQPGPRATYTISDLAREFALTTRAIRFYEDCGLLAPRRDKRTRVYGERERVRLKLILRGKRLGLSTPNESARIVRKLRDGRRGR